MVTDHNIINLDHVVPGIYLIQLIDHEQIVSAKKLIIVD